ncbi:hypothetical protein [Nonomuraea sp. B12E4]
MLPATSVAASARIDDTQPGETWAPVTSAISWAQRSTGTCWNTSR